MEELILEMRQITKEFGKVKALDNVNLKVRKGEIHALCGENGAGKSTLMNVLSGVYPFGSYSGEILFQGRNCRFKNTKESERKGIVIIHQELALFPYLSIAENIFIGNERTKNGIIDFGQTVKEASLWMKRVGLKESPNTLVGDLGVGQQQLVEIAKAMTKEVKLLILDEPTAALNEDDSKKLLELLDGFKKQGITSIIISHKLNEITAVSDSVTILRDGQTIETLSKEYINESRLIKGMVGRDLVHRYPEHTPEIGEKYIEIQNWKVYHPIYPNKAIIKNVDFYIRSGEIVGIAGLMGAGRTEFARSIFGKSYGTKISGTIKKAGKEIHLSSVKDAIAHGLAYATEDRKENGLVLINDIKQNISLASLSRIAKASMIDEAMEIQQAEWMSEKLRIKSSSISQLTEHLSGGNQQKVVLAKWMLTEPDVLFFDEPTRGIDVGAKFEIYKIIQQIAKTGKAFCLISSELPELLGMCDRIYTMNEGEFTGEFLKKDANQERLMTYMTSKEGANEK